MFYLQEDSTVRGSKVMLKVSKNYGKWAITKELKNAFELSKEVKAGDLFISERNLHDNLANAKLKDMPLRKADKAYAERSAQQHQSFYVLRPDVKIYTEE